MKNHQRFLFSLLVSAFLIAGSAAGTAQEKSGQAGGKTQAHPAKAMTTGHALGKAENMSGTISMVGNEGELFATSSNGVPFSFKVTGHTRIKIAGKAAKFADLKDQVNKQATIEFVPMSKGNLAKTIDVS